MPTSATLQKTISPATSGVATKFEALAIGWKLILVAIPIAIILTIVGIYLFFWAVKTEQFNDLEKEGLSILFDDNKSDNEKHEQEDSSQEDQVNGNAPAPKSKDES